MRPLRHDIQQQHLDGFLIAIQPNQAISFQQQKKTFPIIPIIHCNYFIIDQQLDQISTNASPRYHFHNGNYYWFLLQLFMNINMNEVKVICRDLSPATRLNQHTWPAAALAVVIVLNYWHKFFTVFPPIKKIIEKEKRGYPPPHLPPLPPTPYSLFSPPPTSDPREQVLIGYWLYKEVTEVTPFTSCSSSLLVFGFQELLYYLQGEEEGEEGISYHQRGGGGGGSNMDF